MPAPPPAPLCGDDGGDAGGGGGSGAWRLAVSQEEARGASQLSMIGALPLETERSPAVHIAEKLDIGASRHAAVRMRFLDGSQGATSNRTEHECGGTTAQDLWR